MKSVRRVMWVRVVAIWGRDMVDRWMADLKFWENKSVCGVQVGCMKYMILVENWNSNRGFFGVQIGFLAFDDVQ